MRVGSDSIPPPPTYRAATEPVMRDSQKLHALRFTHYALRITHYAFTHYEPVFSANVGFKSAFADNAKRNNMISILVSFPALPYTINV